VQIEIPYVTGMDPYSGMFDLLDGKGLLEKVGNRYKYIDSNGVETLEFRKRWTGDLLEMVMADLPLKEEQLVNIKEAATESDIEDSEE
jgi:hypothetical protein